MAASKRRRYTAEEQAAVVADVAALGVIGAAKKHGVPQSCASRWAQRKPASKAVASGKAKSSAAMTAPVRKRQRVAARRYTPSEKAQAVAHAATHGVSAAAEKFGMSRFSLYGWMKQVEKAAKGDGPSPTSGPTRPRSRRSGIGRSWRSGTSTPGLGPARSSTNCAAPE
jgi:transposase-like protein